MTEINTEKLSKEIKNHSYKIKRNLFFIISGLLLITYLILQIYFEIKLVSAISFFGMIIVILGFYIADKTLNIGFKKRHYFFVIFMAIAGILLSFLYFKYPYFDKLQHFFFPMMYASIVYHIVSKLKLEKKYAHLSVFFIVIGSSALFELLEYSIDITLNWRLQGVFLETASGQFITIMSRIDDTMIDMAIAIAGNLVYSLSSYFLDKRK